MEWAGRPSHLRGVPRKMVFMAVGGFAKVVASFLNSTSVENADTLIGLVRSRPLGVPLITVSNHMSTLDDPLMWGFHGFPSTDAHLGRWVLAAEDICFKNSLFSYLFRIGKCIPITRGGGVYQQHMNEALDRLTEGLHTFPEGKVSQEDASIRRLKWGTASLIVRSPVTPIVLPIVHHGFEQYASVTCSALVSVVHLRKSSTYPARLTQGLSLTTSAYSAVHAVMPENFMFGRRPLVPLFNKKIRIIVGEPIEFDLPKVTQTAISVSRNFSLPLLGWPSTSGGLDEAAQRCLYSTISEKIQTAMESLRTLVRSQKA
ncbi:hypothetical protein TIFTF001_027564 [Ficus carica]|uniref:Tafazzin family protein n=1 Tax=Ficus carica TaxID=3494 RepID=A0AA88IZT2_FICCA|nr:hypothetical protein TIFTF001_027564 [Ficus carica]